MGTTTMAQPKPQHLDRAPHDARFDVKLAGDWLDRWLMELDQAELRAYLQLAHYCNSRTYHDKDQLAQILESSKGDPVKVVSRLARRGLVEVIPKGKRYHYHFPYRDSDGFHRGDRARPSLKEALQYQERMSNEITELSEQDETPELRERFFDKYPALMEERSLYEETVEPGAPRWRLWMEVANLRLREFEERYASLREDHGELFKEVSANVLSHHLELVDGVVGHVLERLPDLFPEVHQEWVIAPGRSEFSALPFVRRQAQRYGVGSEQIRLNVIEALGQAGRVVASVDEEGSLSNMILPSDTGLTKSEERVLFLTPEERARQDSPRNRERVRLARNKYANYLIERAVGTMADFVTAGKVTVVDAWLERVVELVNESLELLPQSDEVRPVKLEHVIDRYDLIRQGKRSFPTPPPLPQSQAAKRLKTKVLSRDDVAKQRAAKKKVAKKKVAKKKVAKKKAAKKKAAKKKATKKKAAKKKATKKKATKKKATKKKAAKKKATKKKAAKKRAAKKAAKKKATKKKAAKKKATKKKKGRRR